MYSPDKKVKWYLGTMGFGFKDWVGEFYPLGFKPNKFLTYYSRIFNSVEIDSTFYGTPNREKIIRWKNNTSERFKISVKVPREITHVAKLIGVDYEIRSFIESVSMLEEKLGVILIQFPATFTSSKVGVLGDFVQQLPDGLRYAIEIRDRSWFDVDSSQTAHSPILSQLLKDYNVCWASTMYPGLPQQIYPTADFLYIRWIGRHGTYSRFDQVRNSRRENLSKWKSWILDRLDGCNGFFGYFNNDYSGFSPETTNLFKSMVGLSTNDFYQPVQKKMF